MSDFKWIADLSVGVRATDDDHQRSIELMNQLPEGMNRSQVRTS